MRRPSFSIRACAATVIVVLPASFSIIDVPDRAPWVKWVQDADCAGLDPNPCLQTCVPDFSVVAPVEDATGTTCGAGNDCDLRDTEEIVYEVEIPNDGEWTFSLCGSNYDTYLFVGTTCCGAEVGENDDFCGLQSQVTAEVTAGTYFVDIEGYSGCGNYVFNVWEEECVVECPPGGIPEQEACGEDINGGCDMEPGSEYFQPIGCGTAICGTAWADGGARDTDWYELELDASYTLTVTGEAEFPLELAIVVPGDPDPCDGFMIAAIDQAAECEVMAIQAFVGPGVAWIRANDTGFEGNPCGIGNDDYYFTVDCQLCQNVVTVEIMTDNYPMETTWDIVHVSTGEVVGSGGPYPDANVLYIEKTCIDDDPTGCYLFTIYDAYGDGICCDDGFGYYNVYDPNGELVCSGGEFDARSESCYFICPPDCEYAVYNNGYPINGQPYDSQCDPFYPFQLACADDFIMPGPTAVYVTYVIAWFAHRDAAPAPTPADYEGVTVTIYDDAGAIPGGNPIDGDPDCLVEGNVLFYHYYLPGEFGYYEDMTDVWRLYFEIFGLTLYPAVTYWMVVEPVMESALHGHSGAVPTGEQNGSLPMLYAPLLGYYNWETPNSWISDVSFCIFGFPAVHTYIPGDCNYDGHPLGIDDVITMIGTYRGTIQNPFALPCPPHGINFPATADPNGNCVANELYDVVTEIAAYKGVGDVSGCPDCPGDVVPLPDGEDQQFTAPSLKTRINSENRSAGE